MRTDDLLKNTARALAFAAALSACGGDDTSAGTEGATSTTSASETATTTTDASTSTTASGGESDGGTTVEETESGTFETTTTSTTETTGPSDPVCGNGIVEEGEACDDGDDDDTDACLSTCAAATCGDGFVHAGVEECDDANGSDDDDCLSTCVAATCGDGFVGPGEACDDGNDDDADACTNACALPSCGDGLVQPGEACDDGNDVNTDACLDTCLSAACGDGVVYDGIEACDDGNADNSDACTELCAAPACDDGIVSGAETDVDCGGDGCDPCGLGEACGGDDDCALGSCVADTCTLAATCAAILELDPQAASGIYTIDPDGDGGVDPFPVSCDMETDGGGWTLVFHVFEMGGHPAGLKENDFIALFDHNRFTDETWRYDNLTKTLTAGMGGGLALLMDQGAIDVDLFAGAWDDVRMACSLNNSSASADNFAQVNGYATTNASAKLHGAATNGTSYDVDPNLQSFDQAKIWHDNETASSNSGHYLCDYTNSGSSGAQFGFCYTDHLNNPNNLDYGDSIVSIAFGTTYGGDSWSVGFTAECGDMGTTAQQNSGTYSIWIR
ncbi:MAG: fibrinogen-like YCDxxxxGGGW domain-containing protein [Nannocystaceae bacterium]